MGHVGKQPESQVLRVNPCRKETPRQRISGMAGHNRDRRPISRRREGAVVRTVRAWMLRLKGIFFRSKDEQDFLEQIQADIELHTEEGIRAGMNPEEARRAALVKFGGVDAATEAWRERRGIPFLETLVRDVTYALRALGRNKGWASVFILSLALGIGAN